MSISSSDDFFTFTPYIFSSELSVLFIPDIGKNMVGTFEFEIVLKETNSFQNNSLLITVVAI